jgi:hypothetical protein
MEISVLVEPMANSGFRAASGAPLHLETEAPTRAEALGKLRQLIERRVAAGAEMVAVSVDVADHPLAAFAGRLKDDPMAEPWKQAMADYRRKRDGDTSSP